MTATRSPAARKPRKHPEFKGGWRTDTPNLVGIWEASSRKAFGHTAPLSLTIYPDRAGILMVHVLDGDSDYGLWYIDDLCNKFGYGIRWRPVGPAPVPGVLGLGAGSRARDGSISR